MILNEQPNSPASIIPTEDGSQTIISPVFGEKYHSIYGAKTESQVVFIDAGLKDRMHLSHISILEMGFGTGLNSLMSMKEAMDQNKTIQYTGYEKFPISDSTADEIGYGQIFNLENEYSEMHSCSWNEIHQMHPLFSFRKIRDDINNLEEQNTYDVIYFDAFAPSAQEELWSIELFNKMYDSIKSDGVLVTYCAKGQVKRNMKAAGFIIEPLPGPPGKREMTRARKI